MATKNTPTAKPSNTENEASQALVVSDGGNHAPATIDPNNPFSGFNAVDGEIQPGWNPSLSAKHSEFKDEITKEKILKGVVATTADTVVGRLVIASAWGRACYLLVDATDSAGKRFPALRLPESGPLYKSLGLTAIGADVMITYRGKQALKGGTKGEKAHTWTLAVRDPAAFGVVPRANALRPRSDIEKKRDELSRDVGRALGEAMIVRETARLENQKALLTSGRIDEALDGDGDDDVSF